MLVYLASPYTILGDYTEEQKKVLRQERFEQVCRTAALLMNEGYQVFCPIAHSHPIEVYGMDKVEDGDFWLKQDFAVLEHCKECIVFMLPGWENSSGILRELKFCEEHEIPYSFLDEEGNYYSLNEEVKGTHGTYRNIQLTS